MNKLLLLTFFFFANFFKPFTSIIKPVPVDIFYWPIPLTQDNDSLTIRVFRNETEKEQTTSTGFGYDIYKYKVLYIHQPNIPALAGNQGFSTAANAQKAAKLVLYKIQNNILPPSVSIRELDSLGVLPARAE
ncbi:MAG: DUF4907 domain-containing protein [Ginsengibacter sp.]